MKLKKQRLGLEVRQFCRNKPAVAAQIGGTRGFELSAKG